MKNDERRDWLTADDASGQRTMGALGIGCLVAAVFWILVGVGVAAWLYWR